MVLKVPPVDSGTKQFPDSVRTVIAANLADAGTPEGAAVAAVAGGGGATKNWISARYMIPGINLFRASTGNGNFSWGGTNVYMVPFTLTLAGTATGIRLDVATASSTGGATARLAIFSAGATPTSTHTLVLDAGTVAIDSTGEKFATFSQALAAGNYLLAVTTSAASSFSPTYFAGGTDVFGISNSSDFAMRRGLTTTMTYGAYSGTLTPGYMGGFAQPDEQNIPVLIRMT